MATLLLPVAHFKISRALSAKLLADDREDRAHRCKRIRSSEASDSGTTGLPRRSRSRVLKPSIKNCRRHLPMVRLVTFSSRATSRFVLPSAQAKMARVLSLTARGVVLPDRMPCNLTRSELVSLRLGAEFIGDAVADSHFSACGIKSD